MIVNCGLRIKDITHRLAANANMIWSCISFCMMLQVCYACLNGYIRYGDSCYRLSHDKENWVSSMSMCRLDDGGLAEINSGKENDFLKQLLNRTSIPYAWVGAGDIDVEGDWLWWTSKAALTYTSWSPGEPNNVNGEDCMMTRRDGTWIDYSCSKLEFYICEMPYSGSEVIG